MTYTTEERIETERLRFESKAEVLRSTEEARTAYSTATKDAQKKRDTTIRETRINAKAKLAEDIKDYLEGARNAGAVEDVNGDDTDE